VEPATDRVPITMSRRRSSLVQVSSANQAEGSVPPQGVMVILAVVGAICVVWYSMFNVDD